MKRAQNISALWIAFALLFFGIASQDAGAMSVLQLNGQVSALDYTGSRYLSRGENIGPATRLSIAKGSGLQIQFEDDSSLEIRGPAVLEVSEEWHLILYSGSFLFVAYDDEHRVFLDSQRIYFDDATAHVFSPLKQEYAEISVIRGETEFKGQKLSPQSSSLAYENVVQKSPLSQAKRIEIMDAHPFSQNYFEQYTAQQDTVSFRHVVDLNNNIALEKLTFDNRDGQSNFSYSLSLDYIYKRYLDFPLRPTRMHFLRAPALRMGGGFELEFAGINLGSQAMYQTYQSRAILGLSWLGMSFDTVLKYFHGSTSNSDISVGASQPLSYGFRAQFERDLLEATTANLLFNIGYSYNIISGRSVESSDTPENWSKKQHAIHLGLAFLL